MCGRYTYYSTEVIVKEYELAPTGDLQQVLEFKDNFNVSPGSRMPVIIRGEQAHELELMVWGLIPSWSKAEDKALKLINARREGLLEKPMWKRLVKSRRCIVPARGFYEWKKLDSRKQPYYITPKVGSVLSFAGLWDEWISESGEKIKSYTIITTNPNKEMTFVHNRMPVILNKAKADIWLAPTDIDKDLLDDLLSPAPNGSLKLTPVSTDVNNVRNNSIDLIYPLEDE